MEPSSVDSQLICHWFEKYQILWLQLSPLLSEPLWLWISSREEQTLVAELCAGHFDHIIELPATEGAVEVLLQRRNSHVVLHKLEWRPDSGQPQFFNDNGFYEIKLSSEWNLEFFLFDQASGNLSEHDHISPDRHDSIWLVRTQHIHLQYGGPSYFYEIPAADFEVIRVSFLEDSEGVAFAFESQSTKPIKAVLTHKFFRGGRVERREVLTILVPALSCETLQVPDVIDEDKLSVDLEVAGETDHAVRWLFRGLNNNDLASTHPSTKIALSAEYAGKGDGFRSLDKTSLVVAKSPKEVSLSEISPPFIQSMLKEESHGLGILDNSGPPLRTQELLLLCRDQAVRNCFARWPLRHDLLTSRSFLHNPKPGMDIDRALNLKLVGLGKFTSLLSDYDGVSTLALQEAHAIYKCLKLVIPDETTVAKILPVDHPLHSSLLAHSRKAKGILSPPISISTMQDFYGSHMTLCTDFANHEELEGRNVVYGRLDSLLKSFNKQKELHQ